MKFDTLKTILMAFILLSLSGCAEQNYKTIALLMNSLFYIGIISLLVNAIMFKRQSVKTKLKLIATSIIAIIFVIISTLISEDIAFEFPFFVSTYFN